VPYPDHASIGRFEAAWFEPETWKPEYPNPAFLNATDEDTYWAAKIVMSFTADEIRAIVKTGQLSDPKAENYLAETLIARRDKVGRHWLTRLSSFDNFTVVDGELRFGHLASQYDFEPRPGYRIEWFGFDPDSGLCRTIDEVESFAPGAYFLAEITSVGGIVRVYLRSHDGGFKIVGVER
jgi:hypothetical protein